jgi:hypothetical protein
LGRGELKKGNLGEINMALEVYYPADIRNTLLALDYASRASAEDDESEYQRGHRDALVSLALAFGLHPKLNYAHKQELGIDKTVPFMVQ